MKANNPTSISGRGKWAAALSAIAILFIACTASAKDNVPFKGTFFRDLSEAVGQVYGRRRKSGGAVAALTVGRRRIYDEAFVGQSPGRHSFAPRLGEDNPEIADPAA